MCFACSLLFKWMCNQQCTGREESHSRSRASQSRHSNQTTGEDVQKPCHVSTSKNYDVSGRSCYILLRFFPFCFCSSVGEKGQGVCEFYFSFVIKFKVYFTGLSPPHIPGDMTLCQHPATCKVFCSTGSYSIFLRQLPSKIHGEIHRSQCVVSLHYKGWFQSARAGSPTQNNTPLARGKGKKLHVGSEGSHKKQAVCKDEI